MSQNHENAFCAENRVKAFLDDIAYLYLRDNSKDVMSKEKEKNRAKTEIPISSCPSKYKMLFCGEDASVYGDQEVYLPPLDDEKEEKPSKPRKKELSVSIRARRIDRIHEELPSGVFTFVPIDTENVFVYEGMKFQLDMDVAEYKPRRYRGEMMYIMDTVVVVKHEGDLHFFNMDYLPIGRQLVEEKTA